MRDPFVLHSARTGQYVLYGTTDEDPWGDAGVGFDCYLSDDLVRWDGPFAVFRPPSGFWGTRQFWAPEVYEVEDGYVMLATFDSPTATRGTQSLCAPSPLGPFVPMSDGPLTPPGWSALDGTLFTEVGGSWLVYCHEWTQVGDGAIVAQRLSADLSSPQGEPLVLFTASQATWARPVSRPGDPPGVGFITDGPFVYRTRSGRLLMLWSSAGDDGYATGISWSTSGRITGPWQHAAEPIWPFDGGHAMVFADADGRLLLTLHQPNERGREHPVLKVVVDDGDTLVPLTGGFAASDAGAR